MKKFNKLFFLVTASLVVGFSSAYAGNCDAEDVDPGCSIGLPGNSETDRAMVVQSADCTDCVISSRTSVQRNRLIEARGAAAQGSGSAPGVKQ